MTWRLNIKSTSKSVAPFNWILWIDCIGGLLVGAIVILFRNFLSWIEGLPVSMIVLMGVANLIYGSYSLFVTTRIPRAIGLISLLSFANMSWLVVCFGIVFVWRNEISVIGITLVVGEGIYVAVLGFIEWKLRVVLSDSRDNLSQIGF